MASSPHEGGRSNLGKIIIWFGLGFIGLIIWKGPSFIERINGEPIL